MPLPGSGQISMDDVRTELGVGGTITLDDSNVRTLFGVASGQIALSDGWGKANTNASISDIGLFGGSSVYYYLNANGNIDVYDFGGPSTIGSWIISGSASDFEVYCSVNSGGGNLSGPTDSWLSLSGGRQWQVAALGGQYRTANITLTIRRASGHTTVTSANINLEADNT